MARFERLVPASRLTLALALSFLAAAFFLLPTDRAYAMKIKEVTSPGGIKAWLVEEHAVPLVALRAVFPGGLRYETQGRRRQFPRGHAR